MKPHQLIGKVDIEFNNLLKNTLEKKGFKFESFEDQCKRCSILNHKKKDGWVYLLVDSNPILTWHNIDFLKIELIDGEFTFSFNIFEV